MLTRQRLAGMLADLKVGYPVQFDTCTAEVMKAAFETADAILEQHRLEVDQEKRGRELERLRAESEAEAHGRAQVVSERLRAGLADARAQLDNLNEQYAEARNGEGKAIRERSEARAEAERLRKDLGDRCDQVDALQQERDRVMVALGGHCTPDLIVDRIRILQGRAGEAERLRMAEEVRRWNEMPDATSLSMARALQEQTALLDHAMRHDMEMMRAVLQLIDIEEERRESC